MNLTVKNLRKQYHLRRIDGVLHAWDVHRLLDLTKDCRVVDIPLSQISELDENYWFDHAPTCREISVHVKLCNEADLSYPIVLSASGRVMDGMHRVVKALLMGKTSIHAVCFDKDPDPDYIGIEADDLPY